MDKKTLLKDLAELVKNNEISQEEVEAVFSGSKGETVKKHTEFSSLFYFIGGGIVFLGIVIMVAGNWDLFSNIERLLITLGSGLVAYALGVYLQANKQFGRLSDAMFLISALVLPFGLYVVFKNYGIISDINLVNLTMSLILLGLYGFSLSRFRQAIFLVFTILSATWAYAALISYFQSFGGVTLSDFSQFIAISIGFSYMFLANAFRNSEWKTITLPLFVVGIPIFLGGIFALGSFDALYSSRWWWDLLFIPAVFWILLSSIALKQRVFLWWGAIFLVAFIFKITGVYFAEQLTWPVALIIAGIALIGVGYYVYYLNNRLKSSK
ncbi:DUF2157 domain-containing protein [Candidatus Berkelbacteria bacterium]|nr:DUF2157 domain-containing protein [Candidatus Berkelbacteria bacterium]